MNRTMSQRPWYARVYNIALPLVGLAAVMGATMGGCVPGSPTAPQQNICATINALDCVSPTIPPNPTFPNGGEACCVVGTNANASVGYGFVFNGQFAGCVASLEEARQICPSCNTITRCGR